MKKKKKENQSNDEWEGCDDCEICKAMKNGDANTYDGLIKAFKKAEIQGKGKVYLGDVSNKAGFNMAMRPQDKGDLYYDAME